MARSKKDISAILEGAKTAYEDIFGYPVKRETLKAGIGALLSKRETRFFQTRLDHLSETDLSELYVQLDKPYVEPVIKQDGHGFKNSAVTFSKKKG